MRLSLLDLHFWFHEIIFFSIGQNEWSLRFRIRWSETKLLLQFTWSKSTGHLPKKATCRVEIINVHKLKLHSTFKKFSTMQNRSVWFLCCLQGSGIAGFFLKFWVPSILGALLVRSVAAAASRTVASGGLKKCVSGTSVHVKRCREYGGV